MSLRGLTGAGEDTEAKDSPRTSLLPTWLMIVLVLGGIVLAAVAVVFTYKECNNRALDAALARVDELTDVI